MKLLQVAFAGLLGLAGLAAGSSEHKADIAHFNDEDYTYHCRLLDIYQCNVLGSCILHEGCEVWCVDLTAPGGAKCADTPLKGVEACGETEVVRDNDATSNCSDLTIQRCTWDGYSCYFVEYCANGCYNTGHGAVCVDRADPPLKRDKVEEIFLDNPFLDYINSKRFRYTCSGKDIEICDIVYNDRPCEWVKTCPVGCIQWQKGVSCPEFPRIEARDEIEDASVGATLGKCDNVPGKCRQCTGTRRGVLTCQDNFCAVQPGDWCARGWSCRDDCSCCRKNRKRGKEVESLESVPQIERSTNEAALPVGVCTPGEYWCHHTNYAWLFICNANGVWQMSTYRGMNGIYRCCRGTPASGPSHSCECHPPTSELTSGNEAKRSTDEVVSTKEEALTNNVAHNWPPCTPGHYWCDPIDYSWLLVCDTDRRWQKLTRCGRVNGLECCGDTNLSGPGRYCDCRNTVRDQLESTGITENIAETVTTIDKRSTTDPVSLAQDYTPGQFRCDQTNFDWILVCDQYGKWQKSSYCGMTSRGHGCCRGSSIPGGSPSCDCRGLPGDLLALSQNDEHVVHAGTRSTENDQDATQADENSFLSTFDSEDLRDEWCNPGTYRCNRRVADAIEVCDQDKTWRLSATCCGVKTCEIDSTYATPHCRCSLKPRSLDAPEPTPEHSQSLVPKEDRCTPGTYTCDFQYGYTACFMVCGPEGTWRHSNDCCGPNTCYTGPTPGMAFCMRSPRARSIDPLDPVTEATQKVVPGEGQCTPGGYRCRQPYVTGHLQVCGQDGVWQISNECCGPYTCYDAPGPEPAHCMCGPSPRSIDSASSPRGANPLPNFSLDPSWDEWSPKEPEPCTSGRYGCGSYGESIYVCDAKHAWQLSTGCSVTTICQNSQNGKACCAARPDNEDEGNFQRSVSRPKYIPRSFNPSDRDPTRGPQDPDEPELCSPGRYTRGDRNRKVYTCNFKDNYELSDTCSPSDSCTRGEHHGAYCVGPRDAKGSNGKSTTLVTVAKDATSSSKV